MAKDVVINTADRVNGDNVAKASGVPIVDTMMGLSLLTSGAVEHVRIAVASGIIQVRRIRR